MAPGSDIHTPVVLDRLLERLDYAVIGPTDGRTRVRNARPPLDAVCHIGRDFGDGRLSGCTAFLISPQVALTAGHCVFSLRRRRTARRILVSPARDGTRRPYGAVWALRWFAHPRFLTQTDARFDFGVIVLPHGFPGLVPKLTLRALSSAALAGVRANRLLHIAGYPSDKPRGELWTHAERMDRFGARLMLYSVDTCPGHSGAPVWIDAPGGRGDVLAIHTRGPRPAARGPWGCRPGAPTAPPGHFNAGVRITDDVRAAIARAVAGEGPMTLLRSDASTRGRSR